MNTCDMCMQMHSASHGARKTVNSVHTTRLPPPSVSCAPAAPLRSAALAPSRLAARRPRSRRPDRARRPSRRSCQSRCPTSPPAPCSRRGLLRPGLHRGGTSAVADVSGGESQIQPCIHEYTVFSRVFSHGSNTRIIRVNTYSEYVFTT